MQNDQKSILAPTSQDELQEIILKHLSEKSPLEIIGQGTKQAIGHPVEADGCLTLAQLTGVTLYEPEELIIQLKPGTPLSAVQKLLDDHQQILAFEPPNYSQVLGQSIISKEQTIGGIIGTNLSGSRRLKAGAARDYILGFDAITGRGEHIKAGGRVMKNVTGYDLPKLMAGSWGTLAVISHMTLKILPKPEKEISLLISSKTIKEAVSMMNGLLNSPYEISGASFFPPHMKKHLNDVKIGTENSGFVIVRLEGTATSISYRQTDLINSLVKFNLVGKDIQVMDQDTSQAAWQIIRDAIPVSHSDHDMVWKISITPTEAPAFIERLEEDENFKQYMGKKNQKSLDYYLDWGGGLIWLALDEEWEHRHKIIRDRLGSNGHALLVKSPHKRPITFPIFQPQPLAIQTIFEKIKQGFDPESILNPQRMR